MAQETQEQPQQAANQQATQQQPQELLPQEAANPLLEAFRILLERFKASQNGFEFSIQFSPHLFMTFEKFEELTKGFDSVNFTEMGKVTFVDLISVIGERQVGPSRCRRDQKRVTVAFRPGDDYGKTLLIDYVHGKRETVPAKCS